MPTRSVKVSGRMAMGSKLRIKGGANVTVQSPGGKWVRAVRELGAIT